MSGRCPIWNAESMTARTIIVAPDSFKGTATAAEAAEAIAAGWTSVHPEDAIRILPMADGGEGTVDAFAVAVPASVRHTVTVTGPVGEPVDASWLLLPDGTAVVELAETSGINLLDPLQPFDAHTAGFGQAIAAALEAGATRLLLAIGGSASTDAGAGMLQVLGAKLLDADGAEVGSGNRELGRVRSIDRSGLRALPADGAIILSDVTNPLLGATGAAAVFGPQKGASAEDVEQLEANLASFTAAAGATNDPSDPSATTVPTDPSAPGAGAAGGTGYGLLLWGATVASGATGVADAIGLPEAIADADVVITGEGRYDSQTANGKVAAHVAGLGAGRTMLVAGAIQAETEPMFVAAESLTELAGSVAGAMADPLTHLRSAGASLARRQAASPPH